MGRCAECGQDTLQALNDFREILYETYRLNVSPFENGLLRAVIKLDDFMQQFKTLGE